MEASWQDEERGHLTGAVKVGAMLRLRVELRADPTTHRITFQAR
jgi:hypothetical protein